MPENNQIQNLEEAFATLFRGATTPGGDEELLRIASQYSLQFYAPQLRCLLFLEDQASIAPEYIKVRLKQFVNRWLELKQYNNTAMFVRQVLDSLSLKKFIGENTLKVNIEK